MSKFRMLLAIPCFALSLALVGCGGTESTFEPAAGDTTMPPDAAYTGGADPRGEDGAAAPAGDAAPADDAAPAAEGDTPAPSEG